MNRPFASAMKLLNTNEEIEGAFIEYILGKDIDSYEELEIPSLELLVYFNKYILDGDIGEVNKISNYLQNAYDPKGFSLGNIDLEEITINERHETSWKFFIDSMTTWYGNIKYEKPIRKVEYFINNTDATKAEYNSTNEKSLSSYTNLDDEIVITPYILDNRILAVTGGEGSEEEIESADNYGCVIIDDRNKR